MKPIVIFDNIVFSLQKAGGISAFWYNLISRVEACGDFRCYYVEYPGSEDNIFRKSMKLPKENIIIGRHLPFTLERMLEPWLPPELTRAPFIFHSSYYRTFSHSKALNVGTFHDLTHEHGGDGNFLTRPLMRLLHTKALRNSNHVCCVSKSCMEDIVSMFPKYADKPMSVAYNAPVNISHLPATKKSLDFLLYVGARDDYKNFLFAVKLAKESNSPIKIAGAPLTSEERRKVASITDSRIELHVYPDEKELCTLYANAKALVFMSEYEGFGIPIVEAQSMGCPVLALRRSAIPEVAGEGAIILDKLDLRDATEAIDKLSDPTFRGEIIQKGKQNAKRFCWDSTASQYIEIYNQLLRK